MQVLLPAAYAAFFIFIIYKLRFFECDGLSRGLIVFIFLLKVVFGTLLWAIYTYYYTDHSTADIYKYFDDSSVIYDALRSHPIDYFKILFGIGNDNSYFDQQYYHHMNYWSRSENTSLYNESHTIIRFNSFVRLFSLGNYHVHTVFICFLSLIGLTAIYKTFVTQFENKKTELILIVFFLPSMLLWSSGVLKEGLIIFTLGIVIYCVKLILDRKINIILLLSFLCLSLYLLVLTKFYAIAAIIPCVAAWLWCGFTNNKHVALKFLGVSIVYVAYLLSLHNINDFYSVPQLLALKQHEFISLAQDQAAKSFIETPILEPTLKSVILNSPTALVNIIMRPHLFETKSPLIFISALENIVIVAFFIIAIFSNGFKRISVSPLFFLALFFSLIMFIVIGLTTPILGALVRYRSTALPFFLIVILWIYNKENLLTRFPQLKKIPSLKIG